MAFNVVAIILLLAAAAAGLIFNLRKTLNSDIGDEDYNNIYTISYLIEQTKEYFNNAIKENIQDSLNRETYDLKIKQKLEMRKKLKEAAYGNKDAKDYIKATIVGLIQVNLGFSDDDLKKVITLWRKPIGLPMG